MLMLCAVAFMVVSAALYRRESRWFISVIWNALKGAYARLERSLTYPEGCAPLPKRFEHYGDVVVHSILFLVFISYIGILALVWMEHGGIPMKPLAIMWGLAFMFLLAARANMVQAVKAYQKIKRQRDEGEHA